MPQWSRSLVDGGLQYRLLIPAGAHVANVLRMSFDLTAPRKQIADALRNARGHHAGWDKRPKPEIKPSPYQLDSSPSTPAPIAPAEMPSSHDAPAAATGQLFLF